MFKLSRKIQIIFLGILFLVIAAAVATFVYFSPIATAQAAPSLDESFPEPQNPDADYRACTIDDIYVYSTHIQVRCTTAQPAGVNYYRYYGDAAHSLTANRWLVLLNTALALNKTVHMRYLTTGTKPSWCGTDCRILDDMWIKP